MDRLAPEIISNIISHFHCEGEDDQDYPIAPLAVLCRHWQPLVEAKTFRNLRLGPKDFSFAVRNSILTPRLSYLRKLTYTFRCRDGSFPVLFGQWHNDAEFGLVIKMLFLLIDLIPLGEEPLLDLELIIPEWLDGLTQDDRGFCPSSDIEITPPDLPELPMVRSLKVKNDSYGKVYSPRALLYMASKMPRLRELDVTVSRLHVRVSSIHQRNELARSLSELPMSIHNCSLRYYQHHHDRKGPLAMEDGEDILTRELRRFSQREGLKDFTFYGCVESSIFWPSVSDTTDTRHWPTLKSFVLNLDRVQELASLRAGEPLKNAKRASWDRIYAPKGIMNDFFQAAAKCSACMPKAEYNSLDFNDKWYTSLAFCTVFPEDPCLKINGKPSLEIDVETVDEWRKTAGIHNLAFKMRVGEDEVAGPDSTHGFKHEKFIEIAGLR